MRRIVAELGGLLSAYAVTTFLVGEYSLDQIPVYPEFAVADGILELARPDTKAGGLQLMGEVGMVAQFDRGNSSDNLGWDGLFGFHLVWRAHEDLALRAGVSHDSSHLGDEFIEDTGRRRIEYTREEYLAGLAYAPDGPWSGYLEYGHGFALRNEDLMEEGRVQFGLQAELRDLGLRMPPYAALDVSAYEEDDWEENVALQLGVLRRSAGGDSTWRFGLEYYDGRSPIGEFFRERERHVAIGVWLDP